jgi:integrase
MKWAVAQGWRESDPVDAITLALPRQNRIHQHRKALPYQEINQCLSAIQASDAGPTTKLALEFLILNASRSGEVRNAVWSEIDLEKALWTIPGARMKAKQPHTVPLSGRAIEILSEVHAYRRDDDFVFPGTMVGKPLSDMTLSKLVKELGFDVDVHGFRTSFKTWCQEKTNTAREVSEMALAHTIRDKAEAAYARSDLLEKRRDLMERWAQFVTQKMGQVIQLG